MFIYIRLRQHFLFVTGCLHILFDRQRLCDYLSLYKSFMYYFKKIKLHRFNHCSIKYNMLNSYFLDLYLIKIGSVKFLYSLNIIFFVYFNASSFSFKSSPLQTILSSKSFMSLQKVFNESERVTILEQNVFAKTNCSFSLNILQKNKKIEVGRYLRNR